jgi:hypothetical protein
VGKSAYPIGDVEEHEQEDTIPCSRRGVDSDGIRGLFPVTGTLERPFQRSEGSSIVAVGHDFV